MLSYFCCNQFELSNFEHKFIKGFADSRRNLRNSAILILKNSFPYSSTTNCHRFRLAEVILPSFFFSPQGISDDEPPPPVPT